MQALFAIKLYCWQQCSLPTLCWVWKLCLLCSYQGVSGYIWTDLWLLGVCVFLFLLLAWEQILLRTAVSACMLSSCPTKFYFTGCTLYNPPTHHPPHRLTCVPVFHCTDKRLLELQKTATKKRKHSNTRPSQRKEAEITTYYSFFVFFGGGGGILIFILGTGWPKTG